MTSTTRARAWMIRRSDGLSLGFTDHDGVLSFDGIEFRPEAGMSARALVQSVGLSVDNSEAVGALSDEKITEKDIMAGRWDGAEVTMWDVDWSDPSGRQLVFAGQLGEITRAAGAFHAELRGLAEPLNAPRGRVFQTTCSSRLGDAHCLVDCLRPELSCELSLTDPGDGRSLALGSGSDHQTGWFERGRIEVLTGEAEGLSGAIKADRKGAGAGRHLDLWQALPILPQVGDRVRLIAGCDKRAETCREKFNNYLNFRGFPHLPGEDWLMAPQVGG
jgi:uncharacterized phage protein (TIGR02218 family)